MHDKHTPEVIIFTPDGRSVSFIIDADDLHHVSSRTIWYVGDGSVAMPFYAYCKDGAIHRLIAGAPDDMLVDHIDGDTLNNRKSNLRIVTPSQSSMNRGKHARATSQYKGVNWRPDRGMWQARIKVNRKNHFIGHFHDEVEAAKAYDDKARELHGEFARLNFPD